MSDKQIRDCYATILKEVVNAIKEDPMLQTSLTPELIDTLEEKWKKNLERKGLLNDNYLASSYFELSDGREYAGYHNLAPHRIAPVASMHLMDEGMASRGYAYPMLASRGMDFYGGHPMLRGLPHRPDQVFSIGAPDTQKDNIIIPSASKEGPKDGGRDHVYMEDEDNKLHVPIPTRSSAFSKKPEGTSAFRSASNTMAHKDGFPPNQTSQNTGASHSQSFSGMKREADGGNESSKPMQLKIELNLDGDDHADKQAAEDVQAPVRMERHDDDDDEDLFGDDDDDSSQKAKGTKGRDSEAMLDKRSESEKSDDEDLFDEGVPTKKVITGPSHNATQAVEQTRAQMPAHQTEMDQRIEVALKKEIPNKVEEATVVKNILDEDDEQLNSDDDISDYNDVLDTGDNILLGYYVKSKRKKDKRKIQFKHCVLRINHKEYLIHNAKGEFKWAAGDRNR